METEERHALHVDPQMSIAVLARVVSIDGVVTIGHAPDGSPGYLISSEDQGALHWIRETLARLGARVTTIKEEECNDPD